MKHRNRWVRINVIVEPRASSHVGDQFLTQRLRRRRKPSRCSSIPRDCLLCTIFEWTPITKVLRAYVIEHHSLRAQPRAHRRRLYIPVAANYSASRAELGACPTTTVTDRRTINLRQARAATSLAWRLRRAMDDPHPAKCKWARIQR